MAKARQLTLHERIERLTKDRDEWQDEAVLRGQELNKLNGAVTSWKDVMPLELHQQCRIPLDAFIARCTVTKGTENQKYKRRGKKNG